MNNTILIIFSFYALTHAIKESVLFDKPRIWLIGLHSLFYQLFSCWFCVAFWAGLIIYIIANQYHTWNVFDLVLWGLASSGISYVMNAAADRLLR